MPTLNELAELPDIVYELRAEVENLKLFLSAASIEVKEASRITNIPTSTIRSWCRQNKIDHTGTTRIRITLTGLRQAAQLKRV